MVSYVEKAGLALSNLQSPTLRSGQAFISGRAYAGENLGVLHLPLEFGQKRVAAIAAHPASALNCAQPSKQAKRLNLFTILVRDRQIFPLKFAPR
jgi:hypothetical protein